jgi:hypothetical protein
MIATRRESECHSFCISQWSTGITVRLTFYRTREYSGATLKGSTDTVFRAYLGLWQTTGQLYSETPKQALIIDSSCATSSPAGPGSSARTLQIP